MTDLRQSEEAYQVDREYKRMERELQEAKVANRELRRRLEKVQQQLNETSNAYNKTVKNMLDMIRENNELTVECERLRWYSGRYDSEQIRVETKQLPKLSPDEARAIRKAMARLHHPDIGGSIERMQLWNSLLDQIEQGH
ncbi:hypothetical protein [Herpetosiphon llansteffanensis]|uniref:hypothetical protein n=1 Tax=Herpetosiphon llansteffanensis TaxID=2094568 RepID=UPI000D7CF363|nr:hypothetical protein [Herpetosiphon llansteffanensis]